MTVIGCGGDSYRDRLERTGRYFDYLDELDQNLTPPAAAGGVVIRVPKQFQRLPDAAIRPVTDDRPSPRLPSVLRSLEGLQAAWTADVSVGDTRQTAYILLATNHHLWERGTATLEETQQFEDRFAIAVHVLAGQAPPRKSDWSEMMARRDDGMAAPKVYRKLATASFPLAAQGHSSKIFAYFQTQGESQVAVLFVLPEGLSADEQLTETERIGLTLQTLRVRDAKLKPR